MVKLQLTKKQLERKIVVRLLDQLFHQGVAVQVVKKSTKKVRYQ